MFSKEKIEQRKTESPYKSPQENILLENKIKITKKLLGGVSGARFVNIENDGSGILKKDADERMIQHERTAYLISLFLGFNFVPPTIIRSVDGEPSSIQEFVENANTFNEVEDISYYNISDEEKIKMLVFDVLIENTDRHGGNFLIKNNKIFAIDHAYAFQDDGKGGVNRYLIYFEELIDKPFPESVVRNIKQFTENENNQNILKELLSELLGDYLANNYIKRINAFAAAISENNTFNQNLFEKKLAKI